MSVYKKLSEVQSKLKAPKNQFNSFGQYNYRSCEDILEAAKPLCIEHGLVLTISDDLHMVGSRYYLKATAKVIDIETSESHEVSACARESETKKGMDDSQITGTASSYARKYALNGLFCIDDTKDADTNEHKGEKTELKVLETPKITAEQLIELAHKKGVSPEGIKNSYKANTGKSVTDVKFIPAEVKKTMYDKLAELPDKV